jgi:hypothetical protein
LRGETIGEVMQCVKNGSAKNIDNPGGKSGQSAQSREGFWLAYEEAIFNYLLATSIKPLEASLSADLKCFEFMLYTLLTKIQLLMDCILSLTASQK